MDLFDKCRNWKEAKQIEAMGLYPYFRRISSSPGTQVIAEGKEVIMIGSNNYLGLYIKIWNSYTIKLHELVSIVRFMQNQSHIDAPGDAITISKHIYTSTTFYCY